MTDLELELELEFLLNPGFKDRYEKWGKDKYWLSDVLPKYTQSWGDLMPCIEHYGISSLHQEDDNSWIADQFHGEAIKESKNYKRVLAECLLKVLQNERTKCTD